MVEDNFLYHDKLYQLSKDDAGKFRAKDGLSRRTAGYQYYCTLKETSNNVGPIKKPGLKYTIHKDFNIGNVDGLWVVTSSSDKSGASLKDRCKDRMENKANPKSISFDDFVRMRTSCYILEEKDGVFYCDCWEGMKGKLCKHSIGLMYFTERWAGEAEVRSVPLGKKRKPGRPKKNPHCLLRSPVKAMENNDASQDEIEIDDTEPEPIEPPSTDLEPESGKSPSCEMVQGGVRRSSRRKAAKTDMKRARLELDNTLEEVETLGNSKPPKKIARQSERVKKSQKYGK